MARVLIKTFGCKTNYADSVEIAQCLKFLGMRPVMHEEPKESSGGGYDAVVVNSCIVTNEAEAKSRRFLRRARRRYPSAKLILTGCGARSKALAQKFAELSVEIVGDTSQVAEKVAGLLGITNVADEDVSGNLAESQGGQPSISFLTQRSRYFLKVQDGCNSGCSYCIIPSVRNIRSKPIGRIEKELDKVVAEGVPEIVITGINVGLYKEPEECFGLAVLLERILERLNGRMRARLSSIEPEHVNKELLAVFEHPRMCPHLHMPLQSGSDRVLEHMRRKYTSAEYLDCVEIFRTHFPHGSVTTDIMVGYPTEDRVDFEQTISMVEKCGFERAHIFRYSQRPGTLSAFLKPLCTDEVRAREKELFEVTARVANASLKRFLGRRVEVVVENLHRAVSGANLKGVSLPSSQTSSKITVYGYGEGYQRVKVVAERNAMQQVVQVQLINLEGAQFTGKLLSKGILGS